MVSVEWQWSGGGVVVERSGKGVWSGNGVVVESRAVSDSAMWLQWFCSGVEWSGVLLQWSEVEWSGVVCSGEVEKCSGVI